MASLRGNKSKSAVKRNTSGLKRGGPGRKRGVPNKATVEVKEMARALVEDPTYRANLTARLRRGRCAPAVELGLWHYAYGKPKDTTVVENPDGSALTPAVVFYLPANARDAVVSTST